jgi:predicted ATP-dependent serine protease
MVPSSTRRSSIADSCRVSPTGPVDQASWGVADSDRIVGRADEMALLVDSVIGRGGRGAVVSGPAGVGKSALVRVVCDQLAESLTVQVVRATRAVATIPFGAFARFEARATSAQRKARP